MDRYARRCYFTKVKVSRRERCGRAAGGGNIMGFSITRQGGRGAAPKKFPEFSAGGDQRVN